MTDYSDGKKRYVSKKDLEKETGTRFSPDGERRMSVRRRKKPMSFEAKEGASEMPDTGIGQSGISAEAIGASGNGWFGWTSRVTEWLRAFAGTHIFPKEGEREKAEARRYAVIVGRVLSGCLFSALLSATQPAFSIYPFGLSFIASTGKGTPLYALSAAVGSIAAGQPINAALCALILVSRTFVCLFLDKKEEGLSRFPVYGEYTACKITVSCVAAFLCGIYRLFAGRFTGYALTGAFLLVLSVPLGTWLFSLRKDLSVRREWRETASCLLLSLLILSLKELAFLGVRAGAILAFFLTVGKAADGKKGAAVLMGLCCGLPFGLSQGGIYACAGLLTAILSGLSATVGMLGAYLFLLLSEGYIGGYTSLVSCLPEASIGFCCATLWRRFGMGERLGAFFIPIPEDEKKETEGNAAEESMASLSDAFGALSSLLRDLSDRNRRSRILDTDGICDRACDMFCENCRLCPICWDREGASTADAIGKLSSSLASRGRVELCDFPDYLRARCLHAEELTKEINRLSSCATQEYLEEGTSVLAADYAAISKILSSHLASARQKEAIDENLSDTLTDFCRRRMYGIGQITAYGKREKRIYATGIELSSHTVSATELQRELSRVCGCRLSAPVYHVDGTEVAFEMQSVSRFSVTCAGAKVKKAGEKESGDTADSFLTQAGYYYGILCDGMGSGSEAARTSQICASYLKHMLLHENPKELTVEMLNAVIRQRSGEVGSTVDLFELDTYTGDGCFIKSGAAPSFILRGKNVYRVQAKTAPLGILSRVKAEKIRFHLREGDLVIMVSDGIAENREDGRQVVDKLCRRTSNEPDAVAAAVLSTAVSPAKDDMTVLVMAVGSA